MQAPYLVGLSVHLCVHLCITMKIAKYKQATSHKLDNLRPNVALYKTGMPQVACKFENKKTNCIGLMFE